MCDGCPGQALCKAGADGGEPDKEQMDLRMSSIAHKVFVLSAKGGVGKSSVCCALAVALAKAGKRVAIADIDLCGPSVPRIMNVDAKVIAQPWGWVPPKDAEHGIAVMSIQFLLPGKDDPVVWRGPRKTNMIRRLFRDTFWGRLDFLLVDTPPGTSDEHLAALSCAPQSDRDGCILVTQPTPVSLAQTRREASLCTRMHAPVLGIVENMSGYVCTCCGDVSDVFGSREQSGGASVALEIGCELLARVPLDPRICASADSGACVKMFESESASTRALLAVRDRVLQILRAEHEDW
jgi:Mrp family chromosome partitioning ATPase